MQNKKKDTSCAAAGTRAQPSADGAASSSAEDSGAAEGPPVLQLTVALDAAKIVKKYQTALSVHPCHLAADPEGLAAQRLGPAVGDHAHAVAHHEALLEHGNARSTRGTGFALVTIAIEARDTWA